VTRVDDGGVHVDDADVEVSEEVKASMKEACYTITSLSDSKFEGVAVRLKTSLTAHQEEERAFLERHTYLTKAEDHLRFSVETPYRPLFVVRVWMTVEYTWMTLTWKSRKK